MNAGTPKHPRVGALSLAAGIGIALLIHFQPEKLQAPSWVAYAAAGAFASAGLAMLAHAYEVSRRLQQWIAVVVVACLITPMLWTAVENPDGQHCRINLMILSVPGPEWMCRSGFVFAAVVGLLILALAVRQALRPVSR